MNERIDHAKISTNLVSEVVEGIEPTKSRGDIPLNLMENLNRNAMRELAVAQVHATLALVEQQRIANLIQLMHVPVGDLSEEIKSALHAAFHDDRDWEAELREGVIET